MKVNMREFGRRCRSLREKRGLEVQEVARIAGIGVSTLGNYEAGRVGGIKSRATLRGLAQALKVDEQELLTGRKQAIGAGGNSWERVKTLANQLAAAIQAAQQDAMEAAEVDRIVVDAEGGKPAQRGAGQKRLGASQ